MTGRRGVVPAGLVALAAAFLLGLAVGVVLPARPPLRSPVADTAAPLAVPPPGDASIFDGLGLSVRQRSAVDSILGELEAWTDSVFGRQRDELVARTNAAQSTVLDVLTEAQRSAYRSRLDSLGMRLRVRRPR